MPALPLLEKKKASHLSEAFMTPAAVYFPQRLAPPVSSTL
jgi:hypothetical protein